MENFTLQLLHAADQEAGIPAIEDAPNFSAVLNALKDDFENTVILSSGDAYIPGPFFSASESVFGSAGRGDILIQNALGFQAIALGNHEFDLGTGTVAGLIQEDGDYPGTAFPYLSSNLDFSTDEDLAPLVVEDGQESSTIPNSLAGNTVITVNGEKIGVVGATTPTLASISSPGDVTIKPIEFDSTDSDALDALAAEIQTSVDSLTADGVDKIIVLSHMQQIAIEIALAERLEGVDVIVAGGSNTLLADETDTLRAGDTAQGVYPILTTAADGNPIAVVNTDGNYKYVGRLVVDFDENGIIIPESIDPEVSGAYATDDEGVAAVEGTPDDTIVTIAQQLGEVIAEVEGNIFGNTEVFLNGTRGDVRTEETNLGNLTADANLATAKEIDDTVVISIKNGGGIRDNIGSIIIPPGATDPEDFIKAPPQANELAEKEEGDISQLDISNTLRFNNGLTLLTLTAEELAAVIEHSVAESGIDPETGIANTPGRFPQVSGIKFSFDVSLPTLDRVVSLAVVDENDSVIDTVIEDGEVVGDATRTFRIVTLNFLAGGGDDFPFPQGESANRIDLVTEDSETFTGVATFAPDGSEQDALAEFLAANFSETSFDSADVSPEDDERIQNLAFRNDTVLDPEDVNVTLTGGPGRDLLSGGNGNDFLRGFNGNDTLNGEDGNDTLSGNKANDLINGGSGDDSLLGGKGGDTVLGGEGNDAIRGGSEKDLIEGGEGDDRIFGGTGEDTLSGDTGNDFIDGGLNSDTIVGGVGSDTLSGKIGNDSIEGGEDNDALAGGSGNDILLGNSGNDRLSGNKGNDILDGGDGDDFLLAGKGNDTLIGGAGNDTLAGGLGSDVFVIGNGSVVINDFAVAADSITLEDGLSVDVLTFSNVGSDTVITDSSTGEDLAVIIGVNDIDSSVVEG